MPNDELSAFKRVSRVIEDQHVEFRRMAISQLVLLFWNIGNKINSITQTLESPLTAATGWRKLLCDRYGNYFTASSLNSMQAFASQYPAMQEAALIAAATDWDHIRLLVNVPDDHTRQQLTVQMLELQMSSATLAEAKGNLHPDKVPGISKARKDKTRSLLRTVLRQNMQRESPLQGNILRDHEFLSFLEVLTAAEKTDQIACRLDAVESALIKAIDLEISGYLTSFSYLVRVFIAQSGCYIGREALQSFESHKDLFPDFQAFLEGFSRFYETETGTQGVSAVPGSLSDFARELPEREVAFYVGIRTNWSQLQEILKVPGTEAKIFYAKLASEEELTVAQLELSISDDEYGKDPDNKVQTLELMRSLQTSCRGNRQSEIIEAAPVEWNGDGGDQNTSRKIMDALKTPLFYLLQ